MGFFDSKLGIHIRESDMPRCSMCHEVKDAEEFSWRYKALGIRQKRCRTCKAIEDAGWYSRHQEEQRKRVKDRRDRMRQEAREYVLDYLMKHPCVECGEDDPQVLDFHHIGGKRNTVSRLVADGASIERIQREIDFCEVRCANCHRRITFKDRGWFKSRD
jgi:hypothetical protein